MSRPRIAITVAAFALDGALGLVLLDVLRDVAWPSIVGLLRAYGLAS